MSPLLLTAAFFAAPLAAGVIAAYRISASPATATVLAVIVVASLASAFFVPALSDTPAPWLLALFAWSWGFTGKRIWYERNPQP